MVENDPFAEFGGEEVKSKPIITENPVSEFGGTEIDETVKKRRYYKIREWFFYAFRYRIKIEISRAK